jgi:hypothetical protein
VKHLGIGGTARPPECAERSQRDQPQFFHGSSLDDQECAQEPKNR